MDKQFHFYNVLFFLLLTLFFNSSVSAGQGLFLTIKSYIPSISVRVLQSNCVKHLENIKLNQEIYIEADCLENNWFKLGILENNKQIMEYKINLAFDGSSLTPSGALTKNDHIVMASILYPHIGYLNSQDRVIISIANPEDDWMKKMGTRIANKPLHAIILPGSHDTGTQGINKRSKVTSDLDPVLKFWIDLDPLKIEHLSNWSITQNLDVKTQLNFGIRYLDLRLCKLRNQLVTCHGISGLSLETILDQVNEFIRDTNHQQEIIILDINHLYNINSADIAQLAMLLRSKFQDKIADGINFSPSTILSQFWMQNKQIIILLNDNTGVSKYPDLFWDQNKIDSLWPNKQDARELKNALAQILNKERKPNKLFVLQTQATPSTKTIIESLDFLSHPNTLIKFTTLYKHEIEKWLNETRIKMTIAKKGNILIEDYTNGIDLTEYAKSLN